MPDARVYCAVVQPPEGGAPITAITTVHIEDYDAVRDELATLRSHTTGDPHSVYWECEQYRKALAKIRDAEITSPSTGYALRAIATEALDRVKFPERFDGPGCTMCGVEDGHPCDCFDPQEGP